MRSVASEDQRSRLKEREAASTPCLRSPQTHHQTRQVFTLADIARDPSSLAEADYGQVVVLLAEVAGIQTRLAARLAELIRPQTATLISPLFTADQSGAMLGTTRHAVYELHRTGKLPGVRVGKRRLRFREEDILALCRSID